jgi:hypothetical protein
MKILWLALLFLGCAAAQDAKRIAENEAPPYSVLPHPASPCVLPDCILFEPGESGEEMLERLTAAQSKVPASPPLDLNAMCQGENDDCGLRRDYVNPKDYDNIDDVEKLRLRLLPHPYLALGISDMPDGYAPVAAYLEAGLDIESRHLTAEASASYDNGHKTDDNDQPNPKGHDRYLDGHLYWRMAAVGHPRWMIGLGYRWSQLSTTNYTKGGNRPTFGAAYDLFFDHSNSRPEDALPALFSLPSFSARFSVDWVTAGNDWQDGVHGPLFGMTMPRPIEKGHIFMVAEFGLYRFHGTVTEPTNLTLTEQQKALKYIMGTCSMGLKYRF